MRVAEQKILIGTCTMYPKPSGVRYGLALHFFEEIYEAGYRLIVVDRSLPNPEVRREFLARGAEVIEFNDPDAPYGVQQRLLFATMRDALVGTSGIGIYTQPEKVTITRFIPELTRPVVEDKADIVLGARTQAGMDSYPPYMITREREVNLGYTECTGLTEFDPTFSVYAFSATASYYFATCRPADYEVPDMWIDLFATILALKDGYRLKSVAVDFRYPPKQLADELRADNEEARKKRALQQETFTRGFKALSVVK